MSALRPASEPATYPALPWTRSTAPGGVVDQHRPGLTAAVGVDLHRRHERLGDLPGNRSGGQWSRHDHREGADSLLPVGDARIRSSGRPRPRPTLAVDRPPSSTPRSSRRPPRSPCRGRSGCAQGRPPRVRRRRPGEHPRRSGRVGGDRPERDLEEGRPGEEPVDHHRRLAVVHQQRRDTEEGHRRPPSAAGTSNRSAYCRCPGGRASGACAHGTSAPSSGTSAPGSRCRCSGLP